MSPLAAIAALSLAGLHAPLADLAGIVNFGFLAPLAIDLLILMTLAVSLNLINGCAGLFSLGHQGFFGVGAYAGGLTLVMLSPHLGGGPVGGGATLLASIIAGGLAATAFGLIVGVPCLRLKGDYLAIATLGFAEIFRIIVLNMDAVGGPAGFRLPYVFEGLTAAKSQKFMYYGFYLGVAALLLGAALLVIRNIMRSSHGRAIYAIREDETAAEILGVDLTRYKVTVFALGAGFAGLAGGVHANMKSYITPNDFSMMFGVTLLLYIVLGGLGSMGGALMATTALFVLEQLLNQLQKFEAIGTWSRVIFAGLLVVIVLVRPQGILGKRSV